MNDERVGHGGDVELLAASHWRIGFPFAAQIDDLHQSTFLLGRCAGVQARRVRETAGPCFPVDHIVCSTVLSGICPQAISSEVLLNGIEEACGARPLGMLRAYECSGWGFALRFFAEHAGTRHLLITIVDADLHRSSTFANDEQWGRSGFGVTTLFFALPQMAPLNISIGRSDRRPGTWGSDTRAFANLVHAIRQRREKSCKEMIFVHFMAKHIRGALEQIVGTERISPNRFSEYGHCFGADPWIGMIEWAQARTEQSTVSVTAASLSNNGYYVLCDVALSASTMLELRLVAGDEASLKKIIESTGIPERESMGLIQSPTSHLEREIA